jgi:serine/threonine protein kinase
MGRVWAARRTGTLPAKQLVAIKTGLNEKGSNPDFERLFMDEARIASLIEHPNVCGLYELGEESGVLYAVMEWCDGASLRELLDSVPLHRMDFSLAARIGAHVAAGLHAAHELEDVDGAPLHVVHRDVSPQNVLIASGGHVKIADFGVAKARGQLHRPTETGEVKGKLSYMAPEQVTSKEIDRRADVFALGCVLYEATVGERPYQGADALSTLYQLLEREISLPSSRISDYPEPLEQIVMKALAKDPAERFQSAADLELALENWLASQQRVVTESAVAELLAAHCSDVIDSKRQRIRETVWRLDQGGPREEPTLPASLPPHSLAGGGPPSVTALNPSSAPEASSSGSSAQRHYYAWAAGGALIGLTLLAVAVGVLGGVSEPAPAASVQLTVAPSGPPAVHAADMVLITVRTAPRDAELTLDGAPLLNPHVARLPRDTAPHVFSATAPGHRESKRTVIFDRDQEILIELLPDGLSRAERPGATLKPKASAAPSANAGDEEAPPRDPRRVRPLDNVNPFE